MMSNENHKMEYVLAFQLYADAICHAFLELLT